MKRSIARWRVALVAGLVLATASCEKNPIDSALEEALDFSGMFETVNGMAI